MKPLLLILVGVACLCGAAPASAYWAYGHEIVAAIALRNVRPETRRAVDTLLAHSALLDTPTCPARTVAQASNWAECVKTLGPRFAHIYAWHYQNVELCAPFDLAAACADGNCVSAQIEREIALLKNRRTPLHDRVEALVLLLHFVGDLHQPPHASTRGDDLGGSKLRAGYGAYAPAGLSWHFIWDGPLAERAISTPPSLVRAYSPRERTDMDGGTVADWSRENWEIARTGYAMLLGGDGCGPNPADPPHLSNEAIDTLVPIVRRQIERGGLRLARLLDDIFDRKGS